MLAVAVLVGSLGDVCAMRSLSAQTAAGMSAHLTRSFNYTAQNTLVVRSVMFIWKAQHLQMRNPTSIGG